MECTSGEYPYARGGGGKSYWELMDAIVRNEPPTLSDPDFSGAFKGFLDMCLHKEPKDRARAHALLAHEFIKDTCGRWSPQAKRAEVCVSVSVSVCVCVCVCAGDVV